MSSESFFQEGHAKSKIVHWGGWTTPMKNNEKLLIPVDDNNSENNNKKKKNYRRVGLKGMKQ